MAVSHISIVCKVGGQTVALTTRDAHSFTSFVEQLAGLVPHNSEHNSVFTFEINKGQQCSLTNDAEYSNMILLCSLMHVTVVYVTGSPINLNQPAESERSARQSDLPESCALQRNYGINSNDSHVKDSHFPPTASLIQHGEGPLRQTKRRLASFKQATGNWFPGALTAVPSYGICPEEEPITLRSAIWAQYIKHIGQEFRGGVVEFRQKLVKFATKIGFQFKYVKNDARYIRVVCAREQEEGCQWFIKGSVSSISGAYVIKEADFRHTCMLAMMSSDTKRLGQQLIGTIIADSIRATPTLTATDIKRDILKFWGFDVSYEKVWRSLEVARANLFGSFDDSFDELRWYGDAILRTNPGSIIKLETEPTENRFHRFFVAFHACIQGFRHCRPMLFVDGTFMKTRYKGTLLSATAKDGNNGLFPVAFAIVESENADNWEWFINQLSEHVNHELEIIYISDRAGGLLHAFKSIPSKPLHFYCLYHLMKNLRSMFNAKKYSDAFKNLMCKLLKDAAYAPTVNLFNSAIHIFKEKGGAHAERFLKDLPVDKWAVAFSPSVHRYGELTSNAAESFNSWILEPRALPVCFMLDCIRMQLMRWFNERRAMNEKCSGALTPRMEELWNSLQATGQHWSIIPTNKSGVMEVLGSSNVVVNINERKCGCYQWQLMGFPCVHAVAVITRTKMDIRTVVEKFFFTDTYTLVYQADINPVPQSERTEFIDLNYPTKILPPLHKVGSGRPKKKRYRSKGETAHKRFLCSRCGKYGTHYWTTCRAALE